MIRTAEQIMAAIKAAGGDEADRPKGKVGRPPLNLKCTFPGCDRKHHGLGYCRRHHMALINWGDPSYLHVPGVRAQDCPFAGCRHHTDPKYQVKEATMEYETRAMQMAAARWTHDRKCQMFIAGNHQLETCLLRDKWIEEAGWLVAAMLPAIIRDVVIPTRKHMRKKIAEDIEADLVCCDLYDRISEATPESLGVSEQEWAAMGGPEVAERLELSYHAICHWAGYSADIARKGLSYRREEEDGTQARAVEAP